MALALSAVEEIELKRKEAIVGCQEILWIPSLKWHTRAVAVRLHFPRRSRLMTQFGLSGDKARRSLYLLTTVLRALWLVFFAAFKNNFCHNAIHHIIYFVFPHWLYFKPHVVNWLSTVCLDGVKWTSRVLRSATQLKLLKKSYCTPYSTSGKHSWLKIAEPPCRILVCPSVNCTNSKPLLSLQNWKFIHFHVMMFLPPAETKMLGKYPPHCVQ